MATALSAPAFSTSSKARISSFLAKPWLRKAGTMPRDWNLATTGSFTPEIADMVSTGSFAAADTVSRSVRKK